MATWTNVSVPRHAYRFPDLCADCLKPHPESSLRLKSDLGYFKRYYALGTVHEHLQVQVPFCKACAARQLRWTRIGQCLLVIGLVASVVLGVELHLPGWLTGSIAMILGVAAFWLMDRPRLGVRVLYYDKNNIIFSFKQPQYGHDFALLSGQVEVVLPDGRVMYGPKKDSQTNEAL